MDGDRPAVCRAGVVEFAFILLLLGASAFAGNLVMRSFRSADHVVLPMVELVRGDDDLILDAGCGAGRTTIALRRGCATDASSPWTASTPTISKAAAAISSRAIWRPPACPIASRSRRPI